MAHPCFNCGCQCDCNTDIDDLESDKIPIDCVGCKECSSDEGEDDYEPDDIWD